MIDEILEIKLNPESIESRRDAIREAFLAGERHSELTGSDVRRMFYLYDKYYFDGYLSEYFRGRLSFRTSGRMTRTAGKTRFRPRDRSCEIAISKPLICRPFDEGRTDARVNGMPVASRTDALMRVMEHEIVHVVEFVAFGNSSCRRQRFRAIAFGLFGHTDVYHELCPAQAKPRVKYDFRPGDCVSFRYKNIRRKGIIRRITRRATVMVSHSGGSWIGADGRRYVKYYVPLSQLEPLGASLFEESA
ncbi:MAG: SprT-like domain-containing protein [Candidatus Kapaibacterium sp.]